jgi:hypothetical protein
MLNPLEITDIQRSIALERRIGGEAFTLRHAGEANFAVNNCS